VTPAEVFAPEIVALEQKIERFLLLCCAWVRILRRSPVDHLREHLAYVKGLAQTTDLDAQGQNGRVTREILKLLEEIIIHLDKLEMRRKDEAPSQRDGDGMGHRVASSSAMPILHCPRCCHSLYIGEEKLAQEEFELVCPECSLTVQVT